MSWEWQVAFKASKLLPRNVFPPTKPYLKAAPPAGEPRIQTSECMVGIVFQTTTETQSDVSNIILLHQYLLAAVFWDHMHEVLASCSAFGV